MKFKEHEVKWKSPFCRKINCQLIVLLRSDQQRELQSFTHLYTVSRYARGENNNKKNCQVDDNKWKETRESRNRKQQQVTKRISIFAKILDRKLCLFFVYVNLSLLTSASRLTLSRSSLSLHLVRIFLSNAWISSSPRESWFK